MGSPIELSIVDSQDYPILDKKSDSTYDWTVNTKPININAKSLKHTFDKAGKHTVQVIMKNPSKSAPITLQAEIIAVPEFLDFDLELTPSSQLVVNKNTSIKFILKDKSFEPSGFVVSYKIHEPKGVRLESKPLLEPLNIKPEAEGPLSIDYEIKSKDENYAILSGRMPLNVISANEKPSISNFVVPKAKYNVSPGVMGDKDTFFSFDFSESKKENQGPIYFRFDLDNDGVFETSKSSNLLQGKKFDTLGSHLIRYEISNNTGMTVVGQFYINISNRSPIASIVPDKKSVFKGDSVKFKTKGTFDPDDKDLSGLSLSYKIKNESGEQPGECKLLGSDDCIVTFTNTGLNEIIWTLTDKDGGTFTENQSIFVARTSENLPPISDFSIDSNIPLAIGQNIVMNVSNSHDQDNIESDKPIRFQWYKNQELIDFTKIDDFNYQQNFSDPGFYNITLKVIDEDNTIGTTSQNIYIRNHVKSKFGIYHFSAANTNLFSLQTYDINEYIDGLYDDMDGNIHVSAIHITPAASPAHFSMVSPKQKVRNFEAYDTEYFSRFNLPIDPIPINTTDDASNPKVVEDFLVWSAQTTPTDNPILVFSSHGNGWYPDFSETPVKSVLFDDKNHRSINIDILRNAINSAQTKSLKPTQILVFEACLMQGIEVAYEFKENTKYIIGSQYIEPGTASNFTNILEKTKDSSGNFKQDISVLDFAKNWIDSWRDQYNSDPDQDTNLSLIDTSAINDFTSEFKNFSNLFYNYLVQLDQTKLDQLRNDLNIQVVSFYFPIFHDLRIFLKYLSKSVPARTPLQASILNLQNIIQSRLVLYKTESGQFKSLDSGPVGGVSISLNLSLADYSDLEPPSTLEPDEINKRLEECRASKDYNQQVRAYYGALGFVKETKWLQVLNLLNGISDPNNPCLELCKASGKGDC